MPSIWTPHAIKMVETLTQPWARKSGWAGEDQAGIPRGWRVAASPIRDLQEFTMHPPIRIIKLTRHLI